MTLSGSPQPRLNKYETDTYSQFGEDGIIEQIFTRIGSGNTCVEFGAADGTTCSNTKKLWTNGWAATLIEGDADRFAQLKATVAGASNVQAICQYLTYSGPDSIDEILGHFRVRKVDFMSIDVDGLDYLIWDRMVIRPTVICIEYNQSIPPHVALVQKDPADEVGASAKALVELGEKKGYEFIGLTKTNLFFVIKEHARLFADLNRDLSQLFFYDALSYAATDYHGRVFLIGEPPWGIADYPYIKEVEGHPIHKLGTVATMIKALEREYDLPLVYVGTDWDVNPGNWTDDGVYAYRKLFESGYPLVGIDISMQQNLEACRWIEIVANESSYEMRIVRRDLLVFARTSSVAE